MSNDHSGHDHARGASASRLQIAILLTASIFIAEIVGAFLFNSLALLSDAGHMFTDVAALGIALAAVRIGERPADEKRTYGYRRFEILAAAFNAILLFLIAGFVLYEAVGRFLDPAPVGSTGMLIVASLGLIVNLIAMKVLEGGREASFNVRGAYLEVWADMLGSLGVLGAAAIISFTQWYWVDALVAAAIGLWVLPRAWTLLRDTTHILLQGVPSRIDIGSVREAIEIVAGVHSVHDLHIWSVAGDDVSLTSHIVLYSNADAERTRLAVTRMLDARFHIHHATVQVELERCETGAVHS